MVLLRQQSSGQQIKFLLLHPNNFLRQQNVLLTELNILLLSKNVFVIPILTNDFVGITKPFFPCTSQKSTVVIKIHATDCMHQNVYPKYTIFDHVQV